MVEVAPHPIHSFAEIFRSFGDKHVGHGVKRFFYDRATATYRMMFGIDRHEQAAATDFANGKDGFNHDYWIWSNFYFSEIAATTMILADDEHDPIKKAAQLLKGALDFRQAALNNELESEYEAGKALDMLRYRRFFSRLSEYAQRDGKDVIKMVDHEPTDYVVIAVDGNFYRLQVLADGHSLPYSELHRQLQLIVAESRAKNGTFGVLTELFNAEQAKLFRQLPTASVETMNKALFVVALDLDSHPLGLEQSLRALHSSNYSNRDHRRALQICVTGNARAAITVHQHTGIGGTYMAKLASALFLTSQTLQKQALPANIETTEKRYAPIPLALPTENAAQLEKAIANIEKRMYQQHETATFRFDGVGSDAFRARGLSADGAFHTALHLAFYRCFGKIPYASNFINLRNVKHGDIWKYTSTTDATRSFVKNPTAQNLVAACTEHKALVKLNKRGDDEVYQAGMSLWRMISDQKVPFAAFPLLMIMMSIFVPTFARRFLASDIWVSNIPALPGVEMMGRASVRLSFLAKGGYAGHYMIFPDHIKVCLVTSLKDKADVIRDRRFFNTFEKCLQEVRDIAAETPARAIA